MSEPVIYVRGLSKRYRVGERERYLALRDVLARAFSFKRPPKRAVEYLWAVHDIDLDVLQGEVVGLIGRNGAGKTTFLKLLSRITRPTKGFAEVRGRVGSLLEVGTGFHPELTGNENIYLSGAILGMTRREINAKREAIVDFAGVERFLDTPLKHYSSGMQMRLAFAVAAHLEPEILLVDEVLAVGDLEFQKKCLGKMAEVSRSGRTIVFVSHQMGQIRRLCERVIWFDAGKIRQSGPTGEVVGAYESSALEAEEAAEGENRSFLRWSICGQGNVVRDGLREVVFHFHVRLREPVEQGHFGLVLMTDASMVMAGWGFDDISIPAGEQEITVRIPALPLRPGAYNVMTSIFNHGNNLTGGHLIEQWYGLPPLVVDTPPLSHPQDRWAGFLNLPAEFGVAAK
jgi:ABC-type polysaccharide/polyol phosphate transport system ATPase subunit